MGEAYHVQYLGHSAWLVETPGRYLLFDCQDANARKGDLSKGCVDLHSLTVKPVFLFFSHKHHDHYSRKLHQESSKRSDVYAVLGDFEAPLTGSTITVKPRESRKLADITVHTAGSSDEGVCYLIETDGLVIYFAGDNADWGDGDPKNAIYRGEVDYLAELGLQPDIAFIPVSTYSGNRPDSLTQSAYYAIDRLTPKTVYPMHGNGRESLYQDFKQDLLAAGRTVPVICAAPLT